MAVYGFTIQVDGNALTKINGIEQGITKMSGVADQARQKVSSSFAGIGQAITGALAAIGAVGVGREILKLGVDAEQTAISFEVFLGSAERAKNMISTMQQYAVKTPFTSKDIYDAGKMLMGFGVSARNVMPYVKMLGDASGGSNEKFKLMSYAFAQVSAAGKLQGQDLLQLINAGFNPLQEISKKTGKSIAELKKDMEKGNISFQMVAEAFKMATSEGGRFYGMLEKQSQTVGGKWSTFVDTMQIQAVKVFNDLKPTILSLIDTLSSFGNWIAKNRELLYTLAKIVISLVGAWALYKTSLVAISLATKAYTALTTLMTAAQLTAKLGTEGLTWSLKSLGISMSALGVGAAIIAIGGLVSMFAKMRDTVREAAGETAKLRDLQNSFSEFKESSDALYSQYKRVKATGTQEDKAMFGDKLQTQIETAKEALNDIYNQQEKINGVVSKNMAMYKNAGIEESKWWTSAVGKKVNENLTQLKTQRDFYQTKLTTFGQMQKDILGGKNYTDPLKESAIKTSQLGGANGGLGEAKNINIRIDTMQKINVPGGDGKDIVDRSGNAIELLVRSLNNLAFAQSQTM